MPIELQSKDFPPCFYRLAVKGLVIKDGKILLLKESEELSGAWELPGGGLDLGEDIHEGLKREVEEEMGIKVKSIEKSPTYAWTSRFENRRGMDWYFSMVIGFRMELENFNHKITEECQEIRFFSNEELENIKLPPQTRGFKAIFDPKDFA